MVFRTSGENWNQLVKAPNIFVCSQFSVKLKSAYSYNEYGKKSGITNHRVEDTHTYTIFVRLYIVTFKGITNILDQM